MKASAEKYVPEEETDEEAPESGAEKGDDALLGNAFDAFQDGDREGFIRSMRAVLNSKE